MKLAHIAQALTLALVIATAWLAIEAQRESTKANDRIDKLTQNKTATLAAQAEAQAASSLIPGLVTPLSSPTAASTLPPLPEIKPIAAPSAPIIAAAPAAADIIPPPLPGPIPAPGSTKKVSTTPLPVSQSTVTATPASAVPTTGAAGSPAPVMASAPTQPLMTPLQRRIKDSPSMAKVKEAVADQGFVTLDAGSKAGLKQGLKFDLRRDASVVGRVTLSIVEEGESVADVDPKSIPEGVKVQAGDELISVVLDR